MDPMISFEELKSRLQKTLNQAKNEPTSFSSTFIESVASLQDKFHKSFQSPKKSLRPINELKSSQKPKISYGLRVQTERQDYYLCGEMAPKSINFIGEGSLRASNEHQIGRQKLMGLKMMKKPKQCHEKCIRQIQRLKIVLQGQKTMIQKYREEINNFQCEKVEYQEIIFQSTQNQQTLRNELRNLKIQIKNLRKNPNKNHLAVAHAVVQIQINDFEQIKNPQFHSNTTLQVKSQQNCLDIDLKCKIDISNHFQLLLEKLHQDECETRVNSFFVQSKPKMQKLAIFSCIQVSILAQFIKREDVFQLFKTDEILDVVKQDQVSLDKSRFSQSIELEEKFYFKELQISKQKICLLQEELLQSKKAQEQACDELQKVQTKLHNILKDLEILSIEYESNNQCQQKERIQFMNQTKQKQKQLNFYLTLVEELKIKDFQTP